MNKPIYVDMTWVRSELAKRGIYPRNVYDYWRAQGDLVRKETRRQYDEGRNVHG
jgi:hypothetical protein